MALMLGIDTGGTFTDCVLFDDDKGVTDSAKSLTTRHDLMLGVADAVASVLDGRAAEVRLVSLSTTLATNAVVEGVGARIGLILIGYDEKALERAGLGEALGEDPVAFVAGGHDSFGREAAPLDTEALQQAVLAQRGNVEVFAISSMFSVRNSAHELTAKAVVAELTDTPVTCGHELTSNLDAPRRALTTALNARLIPYLSRLISGVHRMLEQHGIKAPLMVVKGDGSLVTHEVALERPVETILSGPAASVVGACYLAGTGDAIISDMGGTTTDIAILRDGQPAVNVQGATVGGRRTMVEAVEVHTIGLGGDSDVHFQGGLGVVVGPQRVVPLSLLGHQYPQIVATLERQLKHGWVSARAGRFALRLRDDADDELTTPAEEAAWEMMGDGPLELESVVQDQSAIGRALGRLRRRGLVTFSGFTPTDAAHVLGLYDSWSLEAARVAAALWGRQTRHVYGWGGWDRDDAEGPSRLVMEQVILQTSRALIGASVASSVGRNDIDPDNLPQAFLDYLLSPQAEASESSALRIGFRSNYQLVAVGAPVQTYYPAVAERLDTRLAVPSHSDVASAVGAVAGSVVQRVRINITQPGAGIFRVHGLEGVTDFNELEQAATLASEIATAESETRARKAGTTHIETKLKRKDNAVADGADTVFFDSTITAIATGRPALSGS